MVELGSHWGEIAEKRFHVFLRKTISIFSVTGKEVCKSGLYIKELVRSPVEQLV